MSIPFTEYMLPNGRTRQQIIDRPKEIEERAHRLIQAGVKFEIEVLTTGQISMETIYEPKDEPIIGEICSNGPQVPICVDKLVNNTMDILVKKNIINYI